jgi:ribonucleoside-diphosphate reductase alpha chain
VRDAFTESAKLDLSAIAEAVPTAVRMLDNVISLSRFPFPAQEQQARGTRRIGLGVTGLADALIMLGISYGDERSYEFAGTLMCTICYAAYGYSIALAREKGPFPWFERDKY